MSSSVEGVIMLRHLSFLLAGLVGAFVLAGAASAVNLSDWFVAELQDSDGVPHPFSVVDYDGDNLVYIATTMSASGNSGGGRGHNYIGDDSATVTQGDPYVLTNASFGFADADENGDGLVRIRTLSICHANDTCTTSQVVKDN
jgi:hypothetical protein